MSSVSTPRRSVLLTLVLGLSTVAAGAAPAATLELAFADGPRACPPGTHLGYEGKYCWPDRARACPPGYHLGYEGKYCWPNRG